MKKGKSRNKSAKLISSHRACKTINLLRRKIKNRSKKRGKRQPRKRMTEKT